MWLIKPIRSEDTIHNSLGETGTSAFPLLRMEQKCVAAVSQYKQSGRRWGQVAAFGRVFSHVLLHQPLWQVSSVLRRFRTRRWEDDFIWTRMNVLWTSLFGLTSDKCPSWGRICCDVAKTLFPILMWNGRSENINMDSHGRSRRCKTSCRMEKCVNFWLNNEPISTSASAYQNKSARCGPTGMRKSVIRILIGRDLIVFAQT